LIVILLLILVNSRKIVPKVIYFALNRPNEESEGKLQDSKKSNHEVSHKDKARRRDDVGAQDLH